MNIIVVRKYYASSNLEKDRTYGRELEEPKIELLRLQVEQLPSEEVNEGTLREF